MKAKLNELSARYLAALSIHLEEDPQPSLQVAHGLGVQAVDIGLETLDMARIHDAALASLPVPGSCTTREEMTRRATIFFTEAITPIEKTHLAARETDIQLQQVSEKLDRQTSDLAVANDELQQEVTERKTAEAALKTGKDAFGQLLADSRLLEEHLQDMARKILSANEAERKRMSLKLQDEIAQTLLGIHVRLLALKKEVAVNNEGLTNEIATTQRLVEESVKTINRLAIEFGIQHER